VLGPALGGTRLQVYRSENEALKDMLNLSKAMSYKCALAHLPYGGGKGVIYLAKNQDYDREKLLAAYARSVDKLGGLFKTGTDVGITDIDVVHMAEYTSHMLGVKEADRGDLSTSSCAALGVFYAMKAALTQLDGNVEFKGKRIAIKGVGKLGGELARLVHEAGATIVVADVDHAAVEKLGKSLERAEIIDEKTIHTADIDIYAPCALGNEFEDGVIKSLNCRAVVGGANNQLPSLRSGKKLHDRGILYAPDYIANSGGLIYVADELEPGGFDRTRVLERIERIETTMLDVFRRSEKNNVPTSQIADTIALERIQAGIK
jgi:glutamate dehydrogenase/leucine dehydrogenase